jgi:hypothetical protein
MRGQGSGVFHLEAAFKVLRRRNITSLDSGVLLFASKPLPLRCNRMNRGRDALKTASNGHWRHLWPVDSKGLSQ